MHCDSDSPVSQQRLKQLDPSEQRPLWSSFAVRVERARVQLRRALYRQKLEETMANFELATVDSSDTGGSLLHKAICIRAGSSFGCFTRRAGAESLPYVCCIRVLSLREAIYANRCLASIHAAGKGCPANRELL